MLIKVSVALKSPAENACSHLAQPTAADSHVSRKSELRSANPSSQCSDLAELQADVLERHNQRLVRAAHSGLTFGGEHIADM
jgi:hypothetical protein